MKALRTPDHRFTRLPGYDFEAHYVDIDGLRMHYVDEGPADASPVLLLHGEPSWSYLYREMIPPIANAGHRVIAPDLLGFGKSDKPVAIGDYSYAGHVEWMRQFIEALDLDNITMFCHDWGSLIGLRVAAENERRFARIALANGGLPTGDQEMPQAFRIWRAFARWSPWFIQSWHAGVSKAGAGQTRRPGQRRKSRRLGGVATLEQTLPDNVQQS
jgi:haloalkane dehalogenase